MCNLISTISSRISSLCHKPCLHIVGHLPWKFISLFSAQDLGFPGDSVGKESGGESRSVMSDSLWPHGLYSPLNSPGQNTGVGSLSILQGVFLTQESNRGLLHCRRILYHLSYQGSPAATLVDPLILQALESILHTKILFICRNPY